MQARAIYREEGGRGNVHVFDSRSASAGQAQIALLIRELASRKLPFAQVVEQVEAYISRMQTTFVLENLDNLAKNGRLTRVQSLVTGALRVKLLMGGTREGEIEKLGQGLSIRQTLARMVSRMAENKDHVGRRLIIAHCNCPERAEHVRQLARERCQFGEILLAATGGSPPCTPTTAASLPPIDPPWYTGRLRPPHPLFAFPSGLCYNGCTMA